jgi:hypothetical protein
VSRTFEFGYGHDQARNGHHGTARLVTKPSDLEVGLQSPGARRRLGELEAQAGGHFGRETQLGIARAKAQRKDPLRVPRLKTKRPIE